MEVFVKSNLQTGFTSFQNITLKYQSMPAIVDSLITSLATRVEVGSNTSTVTLRVVRGDKMGLKKRPRRSLSS
jgi:hypothetical protein